MPVALPDLNELLTERGLRHGLGDFQGEWVQRHPFNVPGPIYVGDDLAAGEGPVAAPLNVYQLEDASSSALYGEFMFKQPSTIAEFDAVLVAANHNCTSTYGLDGDSHWTRERVVQWWRLISAELIRPRLEPSAACARWLSFLRHDAERYLRCYVFFLETGRYPTRRDPLPQL